MKQVESGSGITVPRLFSDIKHLLENEKPKSLQDFSSSKSIIVLGDPGAGKTTALEEAAENTPNAVFLKVRQFLRDDLELLRGKTLFIDALDEKRASTTDGLSVIDDIICRLNSLGKPIFRLSCRHADWYGALDENELVNASSNGKITVIQIEPLSVEDIRAIVASHGIDADDFLNEAESRNVLDLLDNPQSLNLIIASIRRHGAWPKSKKEQYELACHELIEEKNPTHDRSGSSSYGTSELLKAAEYLCAVQLLADTAGFALRSDRKNDEYPALVDMPFPDTKLLTTVAKRNVFSAAGAELVTFNHKTTAEYLGACYLARLENNGMPLFRIVSWITGSDGGTLADLRGLYGWLVTLLPDTQAEWLIQRDPFGALLYGDPVSFSVPLKVKAFEEMKLLSKGDPYFTDRYADLRSFGALSIPELAPLLNESVVDPNTPAHLRFVAIDILTHGEALPECEAPLLSVIHDKSRDKYIRLGALSAYKGQYRNDTDRLLRLLNMIAADENSPNQLELRDSLLQELYPKMLDIQSVMKHLKAYSFVHDGKFSRNFLYLFPQVISSDDLPIALDALLDWGEERLKSLMATNRHMFHSLTGRLLLRMVIEHGNQVSIGKLFQWLGLMMDEYGQNHVGENDQKKIADFFEKNPTLIKKMFQHWLPAAPLEHVWQGYEPLMTRMGNPTAPEGWPKFLLEVAAQEERDGVSEYLFGVVVDFSYVGERSDALTVDELFEFAKDHPRIKKHLEGRDGADSSLCCTIDKWRIERLSRAQAEEIKTRNRRLQNQKILLKRVDDIRNGKNVNDLIHAYATYEGNILGGSKEENPITRLRIELGDFLASASLEGFKNYLYRDDLITPEESGKLSANNKSRNSQFIILTALDMFFEESPEKFLDLPISTLEAAAHLILDKPSSTRAESDKNWFALLCREKPDLVAVAIGRYIRIQLQCKTEHVTGSWLIKEQALLGAAMSKVTLYLLNEFPSAHEATMKELLHVALTHSDHDDFQIVTRSVLKSERKVRGTPRLLWLAIAALLDPASKIAALKKYVSKDSDRGKGLLDFIRPFLEFQGKTGPALTISNVTELTAIVATACPKDTKAKDYPFDHTRSLETIFTNIANDTSDESVIAMDRLKSDTALASYSDYLRHLSAQQLQKRREAAFSYPTFEHTVKMLEGGPPVNSNDLAAIVNDHLEQIVDEIKNGDADAYKMFWNTDSNGLVTDVKDEETCRDVIYAKLKDKLSVLDLTVTRETDYARRKEADFTIHWGDVRLPVEVKHHYHKDIWTAAKEQLMVLYMREERTTHGVYFVLWSDPTAKRPLKAKIRGATKPTTTRELRHALKESLPSVTGKEITVIVADISGQ